MKNVIGEEYKSNSHKSKGEVRKEDKKIEKVATGKVKTKKKIIAMILLALTLFSVVQPDRKSVV